MPVQPSLAEELPEIVGSGRKGTSKDIVEMVVLKRELYSSLNLNLCNSNHSSRQVTESLACAMIK